MKPEMLQVQQYLNVHPILRKDEVLRKKYVLQLAYFVSRQGKGDLWSKQMLKLYGNKIVGSGFDLEKEKAGKGNTLKRVKFFKYRYRYLLLTDCLFIRCFEGKEKGRKIVEDIIDFYGERCRKEFEVVYEAFYSTELNNGFINKFTELKSIYTAIWRNRLFKAQTLKRIMITANMSAGKSTLLNALSGKKINRTQNDTCTAKIHYLYNKAGEDGFSYELDHALELDASHDILMTDNDENNNTEIFVGTRFRSIDEVDRSICFIDTPGVNSSMDKTHRQMSNAAIESVECDLLLYLFNGENIGSDDDIKHLKFVKDNYNGKIIFLVNKMDRYRKDVDSVKNTLNDVELDLKKIGFSDPIIYPISAYAGYLGKMALYGEELSEDEEDDIDFLKRKLKREDFCYEKYYPVDVNETYGEKELGELLLHSGILSLEKIIYQ